MSWNETYDGTPRILDSNDNPIPIIWDRETQTWRIYGDFPVPNKLVDKNGNELELTEDGNIPMQQTGSTALSHGEQDVTTAGTAEQLPNESCKEATIIAKDDNTGYVYLGGSTVSNASFGVRLNPGDSITLRITNTNLLYVDADNDSEGVTYIAI